MAAPLRHPLPRCSGTCWAAGRFDAGLPFAGGRGREGEGGAGGVAHRFPHREALMFGRAGLEGEARRRRGCSRGRRGRGVGAVRRGLEPLACPGGRGGGGRRGGRGGGGGGRGGGGGGGGGR